jgi:hypothetical protein
MNNSKILFAGIFTWMLFFSGTSTPDYKMWDFWKERDGVKVYTRLNSGSKLKELKMETVYKGSLASFVAVLQDLSSYERWVYANKEAKLVDYISDTEQIYYGVTDFPWPMSDRDYVVHNKIWQDPKTLEFNSLSIAQSDLLPEKEGIVRVSTLRARWTLTPKRIGEFNVVYTVKSDPEGSIPTWMTNMMLDVGPFKTLKNLELETQKAQYKYASFDFIKEP